jgi:hypothetical protein
MIHVGWVAMVCMEAHCAGGVPGRAGNPGEVRRIRCEG